MSTSPDPTTQEVIDRGGFIERKMMFLLGRSWRTTILGLTSLVCGVAVAVPGVPLPIVEVCKVILPIASGSGLLLAKDARVSGPPPPR